MVTEIDNSSDTEIRFVDTEKFELPPVQDGEEIQQLEKTRRELKKSAIKTEIKTGEKPEWANNIQRDPSKLEQDPDNKKQEKSTEDPEPEPAAREAKQSVPPDPDNASLWSKVADNLFTMFAVKTGYDGWKLGADEARLYGENAALFLPKLDKRIMGIGMIIILTVGRVLKYLEWKKTQPQKPQKPEKPADQQEAQA